MKVLFDNGVPRSLARALPNHEVTLSRTLRWHELVNGRLLEAAEMAGFDVLLTTDKNMAYQQNLSSRQIAIVVLGNSQWPEVKLRLTEISRAVDQVQRGDYIEVQVPFRSKTAR